MNMCRQGTDAVRDYIYEKIDARNRNGRPKFESVITTMSKIIINNNNNELTNIEEENVEM